MRLFFFSWHKTHATANAKSPIIPQMCLIVFLLCKLNVVIPSFLNMDILLFDNSLLFCPL